MTLIAGYEVATNNNRIWIAHREKLTKTGNDWNWEFLIISPNIDLGVQIREYQEFYDLQYGKGNLEWHCDDKPPLKHVDKMIEAADMILAAAQDEYDSLLYARDNYVEIPNDGEDSECERCLHCLH